MGFGLEMENCCHQKFNLNFFWVAIKKLKVFGELDQVIIFY
jgi:hypothetical protein